jgi:GTP-binding protein EngB required for normal cell division
MGQTGVGKSSLINSLFEVSLETHDFKPCTKQPEKHISRTEDGFEFWFWDMPGIGESSDADSRYIEMYKEKIKESDILLWAIHADSRSVTFDVNCIWGLLESMEADERSRFFSKITFVITKADTVVMDPWLAQIDNGHAVFVPSEKTQTLLDSKGIYFAEELIDPFAEFLTVSTFIKDPSETEGVGQELEKLSFLKRRALYKGRLTKEVHDCLKKDYPSMSGILSRLLKNSSVAYCSSRIKFNLPKLMTMIADKVEGPASARFKHFIGSRNMNSVPTARLRCFSNLIVIKKASGEIVFDINSVDL